MEGTSVKEMFLDVQESYQEAQLRTQEEGGAFARTESFHMDKLRTYRLRILPTAPNPDGSPTRPGHEHPIHQLFLELEKPVTGNEPRKMYVTTIRATNAEYSVNPVETYRRMVVEAAKEDGGDKLVEKVAGDLFGGGLKYSYGHCLYVSDLGEQARDVQMMTLSHVQSKDLNERRFKLRDKKPTKNPSYPYPVSSACGVYPVEIEKRKNRAKTEYVISTDSESGPAPLTKKELTALMGVSRTPEIIYRYTHYHLRTTVELLKQRDGICGMSLMETDGIKTTIDTLDGELSKEDISAFSFDCRTKDNRKNGREGRDISLDDLFKYHDELQRQELGKKTEEGQELHATIHGCVEQEGLSMYVTHSMSNWKLLNSTESEVESLKPNDESEGVPGEEEEQLEETEERTGCPRRRR